MHPPETTVNRTTAHIPFEVFGGGQYLPVLRHGLREHEPCRMPFAFFEVLEVAAVYGGPRKSGGRGLIYLKLFGDGLIRRVVLAPTVDHVPYGLDGLAHGLGNSGLDTFGDPFALFAK